MQTLQKNQTNGNHDRLIKPFHDQQPQGLDLNLSTVTNQAKEYHQQWYRWVIVALVALAFAINNLANNAIIPIAAKVSKIYNLSETYANLPIQISFLINPIMNFTVGSFIDSKGLGISFRIGAVMYSIGLLGFCLINFGYHWVLVGAILIALGQPLVMNCPAKVATYWFLDRNRTVATGIISAINLLTLGISLVFPALFVKEDAFGEEAKQQIFNLYSKYFLVALINCVLIIFFMRQKPERLPSAGAQQQKTCLKKTWQIIKNDRNMWKFFMASILLYGTFMSFGSTSNMLFKSYHFEDIQIAIFGICLLVSGVVGSVCYTVYIKKTINYKKAIICACSLAIAFMLTNALLMNLMTESKILISFMILGMGFNLIPMVPISYDLGCELAFPVGQAQIVGIVTGGSMIYTVILSLTISSAVGFGTQKQSGICMAIYIGLSAIGGMIYSQIDIKLRRRNHQKLIGQGKNPGEIDINLTTINDFTKNKTHLIPLNDTIISKDRQNQEDLIINDQVQANNRFISQEQYTVEPSSPQKLQSSHDVQGRKKLLETKLVKISKKHSNRKTMESSKRNSQQ